MLINPDFPVGNAAGWCKSTAEVAELAASVAQFIIVGSITCECRLGNRGSTFDDTPLRALNSLGLPNPGIENIEAFGPRMTDAAHKANKPIILSVAGFSAEEYGVLSRKAQRIGFDGIELNLGCPNIVTTRKMVEFVQAAGPNVAATITAHHLLFNRNALFKGGIRPHHYCLPVLKREEDRQALLTAATSGSPQFFLGTDSAPHARDTKETACVCAGCYTAHAALPLYAEAFDTAGALNRLKGFASHFGADFYRLPRNRGTVTLIQKPWTVPKTYPFDKEALVPLRAGEEVLWQVED